jgi:hypothetical protein
MKCLSQIDKVILNRRGDSHLTPQNKRGFLCCPNNHDLCEKKALQ